MASKYLNDDGSLNRQLVINDVWTGLKSQGFALSVTRDAFGRYNDTCAYNGLNGNHCAIGWLMTDLPAHVVDQVEGTGVSLDSSFDNELLSLLELKGISESDLKFLFDLQNVHDDVWDNLLTDDEDAPDFDAGAQAFESSMVKFVVSCGLVIPQ